MHMPIMDINIPSNAMTYFQTMVPIVTFDLMNSIEVYQEFVSSISKNIIQTENK